MRRESIVGDVTLNRWLPTVRLLNKLHHSLSEHATQKKRSDFRAIFGVCAEMVDSDLA